MPGHLLEAARPAALHMAPDVFLIPDTDRGTSIVYAPLLGVLARVNASMARLVLSLRNGSGLPDDFDESKRRELRALGLVSEIPYPPLAPDSRSRRFEPTTVSLFLTGACNLACRYCHASANEHPIDLDMAAAKAAVNLICDNATRLKRRLVRVVLHGGGEPTLVWRSFQEIVLHARQVAAERGLQARISVGTNGVMPEGHAEWIARNLDGATLSLDGAREIHDRLRPTTKGGPSFDQVIATARIFDKAAFDYGVRVTVTSDWVEELPAAIDSTCCSVGARTIQVEPVFFAGRAARADIAAPPAESFIAAFRQAKAIALSHGRRLTYSGARLGRLTDRFCEAAGGSFAVTAGGQVSCCYEVTDHDDPRSDAFFWGSYAVANNCFRLDDAQRAQQTRWTVHDLSECSDCICKWTCAGDCPAKRLASSRRNVDSRRTRCEINRALTRDLMLAALDEGTAIQLGDLHSSEGSQCT